MIYQHNDTYTIFKIWNDGSRELLRVCKDCNQEIKMDGLVE